MENSDSLGEETIFDKILRHEIPADIVYEDEETLAFLDINPRNPGHTLVVPKKAARNIFDADDDTLAAVMRTIKKIAPVIQKVVEADGINIAFNNEAAAGQIVFYLHAHIIPRFADESSFPTKTKYEPGEAALIAEKIRSQLKASEEN